MKCMVDAIDVPSKAVAGRRFARVRRRSGSTILEFALVAPVLLMITMGII